MQCWSNGKRVKHAAAHACSNNEADGQILLVITDLCTSNTLYVYVIRQLFISYAGIHLIGYLMNTDQQTLL